MLPALRQAAKRANRVPQKRQRCVGELAWWEGDNDKRCTLSAQAYRKSIAALNA